MTESIVCGLIGTGISFSLTPPMHEREAQHHGLAYAYKIIDLDVLELSVDDLPRLVATARDLGFRGLNITHPCKQRVIELLDDLSSDAARLGAVNTVLFDDGRAIGHNTDWTGFGRNLDRGLPAVGLDHVVQLGAGGAGAAVAYAVLSRGARHYTVVDSDLARATALSESMSRLFPSQTVDAAASADAASVIGGADGLINATPMGMAAHPGMAVAADVLRPDLWVADVVYRPAETELLSAARSLGAPVLSGTGMTVFQAVAAFEIFTGLSADADRMTDHMRELLGREEAVLTA
ncbi:shikimate dehydrogenase (NADP(+)) [Rhodococcoides trifolii]|uniref:Shikimate dehydrogenase (NADP(+)) n=1 Tax=Rhodococcoides trifolii TaxID=908250 RepID=A0A917FSU8_9NOCA|nr:shikimate dehydrogenase [Rhodococcus trifolii]GGG02252.1 shikimate dehydrogenase (NADP(+)) [Rhodococcus trifolii]